MLVCFACSIITTIVLRYYLIWENAKRDAAIQLPGAIEVDGVEVPASSLNLLDRTDRELHQFRYVY